MRSDEKQIIENEVLNIAHKLCRDAIWSGNACNWIGIRMDNRNANEACYYSLGNDLYEGTSGIALFLALVHRFYPDRLFLRTAAGALQHSVTTSRTESASAPDSVFSGATGRHAIYLRTGEWLSQPEWSERAMQYFKGIAMPTSAAIGKDIITGPPGVALVLMDIIDSIGDSTRAMEALHFYAGHIYSCAIQEREGVSWKTMDGQRQNLTGFAHGASGFGYALARFGCLFSDSKYLEMALDAFRYEDGFYNEAEANWPDFRELKRATRPANSGPVYMNAWCHGAPGIALARLLSYYASGNEAFLDLVDAAFASTQHNDHLQIARGNENYSLCHGIFGNDAILLLGDRLMGRDLYTEDCKFSALRAINYYAMAGREWPCGLQSPCETPGLMLGTSGIGYHLLSLLHDEVPPVLALSFSTTNAVKRSVKKTLVG
jgi:lantibiotic biosynthesis protein